MSMPRKVVRKVAVLVTAMLLLSAPAQAGSSWYHLPF